MKFWHSILLSLLVHTLVILPFVFSTEPVKKKEEPKAAQTAVKFLVEEKKIRPSDLKSDSYYSSSDAGDQICTGKDKSYIGVGMVIQPGTGRVLSAPERFPAYKAGIRTGNVIADPYGPSIVNGYVNFLVESDNVSKYIKVKAERICYK